MQSVDDDGVRMRALAPVGISLVMFGRTAEALALTEGSSGIAESVRERLPRAPGWALSARVSALSFAGRTTEAIGLIEESSAPSTPTALGYLGILALVQGRPTDGGAAAQRCGAAPPQQFLQSRAELVALPGR